MNQFWRGLLGSLIGISAFWVGGFLFHLWPPFPREEAWYHMPRFFTIAAVSVFIAWIGWWIAIMWEPKRKDRK